ncbi:hypothetical protein BG000_003753, partial [Podila horticola]
PQFWASISTTARVLPQPLTPQKVIMSLFWNFLIVCSAVTEGNSFWGLFSSEGTYIEYVPHTLTLNDTPVLEMYWKMIAFRQIMISLGGEMPNTPDLSGLCNRPMP